MLNDFEIIAHDNYRKIFTRNEQKKNDHDIKPRKIN